MVNLVTAFTQNSGLRHRSQQDALWNGLAVFQSRNLATASVLLPVSSAFLAVADGVSVSPVPQLASRFVIEAMAQICAANPAAEMDIRMVRRVHGLLCDRYAHGRTFGTSSTLVAVQVLQDLCHVLNVGDSRAYRIAADGTWQRLSRDHTVLEELREQGQASPGVEYARLYDALASCLIADDEETEFSVHQATAPFLPGDSLLLCSDGVHDSLGEKKLESLFDPLSPVDAQVELIRASVLKAGAPDNFSLILTRRMEAAEQSALLT